MVLLQAVADEVSGTTLRQRLQVRFTAVGDGAKDGSLRAVQKVPFFCGDGPLPTVEWCAS
jgi:hypothetical protein